MSVFHTNFCRLIMQKIQDTPSCLFRFRESCLWQQISHDNFQEQCIRSCVLWCKIGVKRVPRKKGKAEEENEDVVLWLNNCKLLYLFIRKVAQMSHLKFSTTQLPTTYAIYHFLKNYSTFAHPSRALLVYQIRGGVTSHFAFI